MKQASFTLKTMLKKWRFYDFAISLFLLAFILLSGAYMDRAIFIDKTKTTNDIRIGDVEISDGSGYGSFEIGAEDVEESNYQLGNPINVEYSLLLDIGYEFSYLEFGLWGNNEQLYKIYLDNPTEFNRHYNGC